MKVFIQFHRVQLYAMKLTAYEAPKERHVPNCSIKPFLTRYSVYTYTREIDCFLLSVASLLTLYQVGGYTLRIS